MQRVWLPARQYSEICYSLTQTAEVVAAVSALGLAAAVVQRREEEGEELEEVVKMRAVMGSGARKMAAAAARRTERSRRASWSLEGAAAASCRLEAVGPFSGSSARCLCWEGMACRVPGGRQQRVVSGRLEEVPLILTSMKRLGLL